VSRILLFGSTGFLGKSILDAISKDENEIFTLNRSVLEEKSLSSFRADVLVPASYTDLIKQINPQVLITTAWATTDGFWHSESNYDYMLATIDLADFALSGNVDHFIGLGSSAELGNTIGFNSGERVEFKPTTEYGKSKAETGLRISKIAKSHGKNFSWLRIFQAYGRHERESRLIPLVIQSLLNGKKIEIQDASKVLDWIHSEDVAGAINFLLQKDVPDHFLDVGTSEGTSVLKVVEMIATILGSDKKLIEISNKGPTSQISQLVCSPESALFRAGWIPKISLDEGLRKVVEP
jgi:nucleoside-diphosphate-sugar epimerase